MSHNLKTAAAKAVLSGGLALAGLALASGTRTHSIRSLTRRPIQTSRQ
jgi:hypothetical protein